MRVFLSLLVLCFISNAAHAALDIDVSEPNLEITTGFTGDTLTVFGTAQPKGDIIIIVKGPEKKTTIHRKVKIMGLWLTGQSVTFNKVPGYYNVASSRPVLQIANETVRRSERIGINSLTFDTEEKESSEKKARFQEALIQGKQLAGLYSLTPDAIEYVNDTLFKTRIYMPANVPIGQYEIEAFLFKDGQIVDKESHPFQIAQGGLAGDLHNFSNDAPFLYGVSVILIALFSSFMAITLLRRE